MYFINETLEYRYIPIHKYYELGFISKLAKRRYYYDYYYY